MSRTALALAILATPGLFFTALSSSSDLVPSLVAPAIVGVGAIVAAVGAWRARTRVHATGAGLAILGASLTGVGLAPLLLAIAVASAALMIASLNLHLVLPTEGGISTIVVATLGAVAVGGLALLVEGLAGWLGGGGVDAAGGITAWLVLVAAGTWGLVRWSREAKAG